MIHLVSATGFLAFATAKNMALGRIRRLRQPRYLIASGLGLAYVWTFLLRRFLFAPPWLQPDDTDRATAVLLVMVVGTVASAWVLGGDEAAVQFTEAEVQYLFAGPVSRTHLLHYKLLRNVIMAGWSAAFTTLLVGTRLTPHWGLFFLGAWIGLATLSLHAVAASLTRALLVEQGLAGIRRRLVTALVFALAIGAILFAETRLEPVPHELSVTAWLDWLARAISTAPMTYVVWPAKAAISLALSTDGASFAKALPAALLSFGLHYLWAASSPSAFEDGSVKASEARGRSLDALRSGQARWIARTPPPFVLGGEGMAEMALLWRSLVATTRILPIRLLVAGVVLFAVIIGFAFSSDANGLPALVAVGVAAWSMAGLIAFLGPQSLVVDVRLDHDRMEVVRSWPLSGFRIILGTLSGPSVLSSLVAIGFVGAGAAMFAWEGVESLRTLVAWSVAGALPIPGAITCGYAVQAGFAIVFPTWSAAQTRAGGGFEAFGQRLLLLLAGQVIIGVAFVPASLAGVIASVLLGSAPGLVVGGAVAGAVLLVEAGITAFLAGRALDRFEPPAV